MLAWGLLALAVCSAGEAQPTPVCTYELVNSYPHDSEAFTQGLVVADGVLYEGTGLYGESSLRRVDLETGVVEQSVPLGPSFFGEGITVVGDRILQLTWQNDVGFVYDRDTFAQLDTFTYTSEGWGLTFDGSRLIRSDGSSTIDFWDATTYEAVGSIIVTDDVGPVIRLNELEWIQGEIFANIWYSDRIARIDPTTGKVRWYVDLSGLGPLAGSGAGVLNGIAWDADGDRLFVTGKNWSWLFEIALPDCPLLGVFSDGFESGDASRWSAPAPAPTLRSAGGRRP